MATKTISAWVAATALASGFLVGCGGDSKPAVCSDIESLGASVDELKNVDVNQGGLSKLEDDFQQVKSDLSEVKDSAKSEYADEVEAVDQAATSLSSDLSAATSSPSADTIGPLRADIQSLGNSLTALKDAVKDTC